MFSSSTSAELKRLEDELFRLGLHQTVESLKNETRVKKSERELGLSQQPEVIPEGEDLVGAQVTPRQLESSLSESALMPLAIAQPVISEQPSQHLMHRHSADSFHSRSLSRSQKAVPQFVIIPVQDQTEFRMTQLSNKTSSDRTNYEEYPATPVSFSAQSSTSKESTTILDPPTNVPSRMAPQNPFTWDLSEGNQSILQPFALPGFPQQQNEDMFAERQSEGKVSLEALNPVARADSISRVDSLSGSKELSEAISSFKMDAVDALEDEEDKATIVSLQESDVSPFAADFMFSPPDPCPDSLSLRPEEPKQFSFPQTPQGQDAGCGGLNVLRSFNSTRSNDFLSCGTNSSKTAKSPLGLELSSNSLSSGIDVSSGDLNSPNDSDVPTPLPLLFNPLGSQKRVSLSLNACGYDWDAILNDIRTSKAQGDMPLDTFPEDLWMNKGTNKDNKPSDYLVPHYSFSQSYVDETYDLIDLKIYHKRGKTGFESNKDLYVEMGDIIAGRYQVIKVVGSAVFSKAIKAIDLKLNTSVCLKMVKNVKDYFDQSLDEIKLLRYLNRLDPDDKQGVVQLLDFFYYREHLFLVFELLRQNLFEIQQKSIRDCKSVTTPGYYFTMPRMKSIARQILTTLQFLHSKNIIHSDLKPENVLIKKLEVCAVKVIDLGSSCFTTDFLGSYVQSRSYRAPEVVLGAEYDQKIDVWSLGCMLVELFTGFVLYQSRDLAELLAKIESVLGPMPPWMIYQGKFASKYYTTSLKIFRKNPTSHDFEILSPVPCGLAEILGRANKGFIDFVSLLLTADPNKRPSAAELMKHAWLSEETK